MKCISIDLSSLVFVELECGRALFVDGEGDEIVFYCAGNTADCEAAVKEIKKAVVPVD